MSIGRIAPYLILLSVVTSLLLLSCGERAQKAELDKSLIGKTAICPVTGDEFTIHDLTPVVKYRGDLYYMCCPGCDTEFMKDPEKYIMNVSPKEQSIESERTGKSEILYWTCTMHPEVKSDKEGNCPICGMALIPVYEREEKESALDLSDRQIELAGIRMVPATPKHLYRELRVVGMVAYDPDLVIAQEEYVNALAMSELISIDDEVARTRAAELIQSAKYKLELLGMDGAEINVLRRTRIPEKSLVMPRGRTWIYADVYEPDLAWVKRGQQVSVVSSALSGSVFTGRVQSVSPVLDARKRAARVRIKLYSAESDLTPGMYVEASIFAQFVNPGAQESSRVLAVPGEAVLDMGVRQIVWVYLGQGQFQPRLVKLGPQSSAHDDKTGARYYPVLEGLAENEMVVTNGNFLIDSESSLTGVAAISYGGALGVEDRVQPPTGHQH
jgi:Cu(I)/Ag(I) efflux system membrane fusion protein